MDPAPDLTPPAHRQRAEDRIFEVVDRLERTVATNHLLAMSAIGQLAELVRQLLLKEGRA